jgi:putative transposase
MARQQRLFIPDCPTLIRLQGIADQVVFPNRQAYAFFHARLPISAEQEGVQVHAYGLSASTAFLLVRSSQVEQLGRFVQNLNRHFSPVIKTFALAPAHCVWAARFKSTEIEPGLRSLKACLYVESLGGVLMQASDLLAYPWSSFAAHAGVRNEPWLVDLQHYWQLGNTPFERQSKYKEFTEQGSSAKETKSLESCLARGWLWGSTEFCQSVAHTANRAVMPRPRGRPLKVKK